jgi:hypothetical protein
MYWREREGYYTYDQIFEAIGYAKEDPDCGYHRNDFYDHLVSIRERMAKYQMTIIEAKYVNEYDKWTEAMVGTYKIRPKPFIEIKNTYTEYKKSAPNFRNAECCENCVHFEDTTEQDCTLSGECGIHTETNTDFDPPVKSPFNLSGNGVCDDFVMR